MSPPVCTIVGGPNGAGKATFAMKYLPKVAGRPRFINADLIAAGLSPLAPDTVALNASRIFLGEITLGEITDHIERRLDFAFETTLSGKGHLRTIRRMRADGWRVQLFYLWLPDVEMAVERVRERVRHGGHAGHPPAVRSKSVRIDVRIRADVRLDLLLRQLGRRAAPDLRALAGRHGDSRRDDLRDVGAPVMTEMQEHAQQALQALREAVAEMMERKRRLGQYVVVWQDGRPVRMIPLARNAAEVPEEDGTA